MGGGTPHRKNIYWKRDTAHTLCRWGNRTYLVGVGTPQNIERKGVIGSVKKRWAAGGGWVGAMLGLPLASWNLSDFQLS